MKVGLNIVGVLLALMGAIWFLQGIGVLQGSFMSNQSSWMIIGLVLFVLSAGLLIYNNRRQARG